MMQPGSKINNGWMSQSFVGLGHFVVLAMMAAPVQAQVSSDGSLPTPTVVNANGNQYTITGGTQAGANLFHSFSRFSVPNNGAAIFTNSPAIDTIIGRVTGTTPSTINGILRANGSTNLILMNPNGVVFGRNARLDLGGSLIVTTANDLEFAGIGRFSASLGADESVALLTIRPSAFFFNLPPNQQPQGITVEAHRRVGRDPITRMPLFEGLRVAEGKNLLLVSGNILLENGVLNAPGGHVNLASLNESGAIGLDTRGALWQMTLPEGVRRGEVKIKQDGQIDVRSRGGGSITLQVRKLDLSTETLRYNPYEDEAPTLMAGIGVGQGSSGAQAGDIRIEATDEVRLRKAAIVNDVFPAAVGNSGSVFIQAPQVKLYQASTIRAVTYGQGNAGQVQIIAPELVELGGEQPRISNKIVNQIFQDSTGTTGGIVIETGRLRLREQAEVSTRTQRGDAADILIKAGSFSSTDSEIASTTDSRRGGKAGDVTILVQGDVTLREGGSVRRRIASEVTRGAIGKGGNVLIEAGGAVRLQNGAIVSTSTSGRGDAGNVTIKARSLVLNGGSDNQTTGIFTSTNGRGKGGDLVVAVQEVVRLTGSSTGIGSGIDAYGVGDGGNLFLTAGSLTIKEGARLTNGVFGNYISGSPGGRGNGGNIVVDVAGDILFDGRLNRQNSGVDIGVFEGARGQGGQISIKGRSLTMQNEALVRGATYAGGKSDAGDIAIEVDRLTITSDAEIITNAFGNQRGRGDAGDISVKAQEIKIIGNAQQNPRRGTGILSNVEANAYGRGGTVTVQTNTLTIQDGGQISSRTAGGGNAGKVMVSATESIDLRNRSGVPFGTGLLTDTQSATENAGGRGGDISVTAPVLRIADGAVISSSTRTDNQSGGAIQLQVSELDVRSGGQVYTTTFSSGQAGKIIVDTGYVTLAGKGAQVRNDRQPGLGMPINEFSGLFADTGSSAGGTGGSIQLRAGRLEVLEEAKISARSGGSGQAGSLDIVANQALLRRGDIATEAIADGAGGNLRLSATQLTLLQGSRLSAQSRGTGRAGNLDIAARQVIVDNSKITTETASQDGGDIRLQADILLLRRSAEISTTAGTAQAGGNGGNISIDSQFVIAVPNENSDISADAFNGNGGSVRINAQGVIGTQFRSQRTPQSDITASSTFGRSGTVAIITPNIDPSRGLVALAINLTDPAQKIVQRCRNLTESGNSFVATGRGGLPSNPIDPLAGETALADWLALPATMSPTSSPATQRDNPAGTAVQPSLVEAQEWQVDANGGLRLVASLPKPQPHQPSWLPTGCPSPRFP